MAPSSRYATPNCWPPATAIARLPVRLRLDGLPVSTAPPASRTSVAGLRPSSGISSTCSFVMTAPTAGFRVSTRGADASTDTVSSRLPSSIRTGMTGLLLTCSTTPVCVYVRNPASVASRRYGPMGRLSNEYAPASSVTASRLNPVSVWIATTVTPGNTPPLESATMPLICAVACAHAFVAASRRTIPTSRVRDTRIIKKPPGRGKRERERERESVEPFVFEDAPAPAVLRTLEREESHAMIGRVAAGVAGDDDLVTRLDGVSRNFALQLPGRAPFDDVAVHRPVLLLHHHVHEGVRAAEQELHDLPLDRHRLIFKIGRRKRMMCRKLRADGQHADRQQRDQITIHDTGPSCRVNGRKSVQC